MTFGEDWAWGSSVAESEAILARFLMCIGADEFGFNQDAHASIIPPQALSPVHGSGSRSTGINRAASNEVRNASGLNVR